MAKRKRKKKIRFKTTFSLISPTVRITNIPEKDVLGFAYKDEARVEIDPRQCSKEFLDTLIHELIHCFFPNMDEEYVEKMSTKIANQIWSKGYRRIQK